MRAFSFLVFIFIFSKSNSQVNANLHCPIFPDSIIITEFDMCGLTNVTLRDLNFNKSQRYYKRFIYFIGGYNSLRYYDYFYLMKPKEGLVMGLRYRSSISNSIVASVKVCLTDTSALKTWDLKRFYCGKISFLGINIDSNTRKNMLDESEKLIQFKSLEIKTEKSCYISQYVINNITYIFKFNEYGQILTLELSDIRLN